MTLELDFAQACSDGNINKVKAMLAQYPELRDQDRPQLINPLTMALISDRVDVVELLLETYGEKANTQSALLNACRLGEDGGMKCLDFIRKNYERFHFTDGTKLEHVAAACNDINYFLNYKGDEKALLAYTNYYVSPLFFAMANGCKEVVEALRKRFGNSLASAIDRKIMEPTRSGRLVADKYRIYTMFSMYSDEAFDLGFDSYVKLSGQLSNAGPVYIRIIGTFTGYLIEQANRNENWKRILLINERVIKILVGKYGLIPSLAIYLALGNASYIEKHHGEAIINYNMALSRFAKFEQIKQEWLKSELTELIEKIIGMYLQCSTCIDDKGKKLLINNIEFTLKQLLQDDEIYARARLRLLILLAGQYGEVDIAKARSIAERSVPAALNALLKYGPYESLRKESLMLIDRVKDLAVMRVQQKTAVATVASSPSSAPAAYSSAPSDPVDALKKKLDSLLEETDIDYEVTGDKREITVRYSSDDQAQLRALASLLKSTRYKQKINDRKQTSFTITLGFGALNTLLNNGNLRFDIRQQVLTAAPSTPESVAGPSKPPVALNENQQKQWLDALRVGCCHARGITFAWDEKDQAIFVTLEQQSQCLVHLQGSERTVDMSTDEMMSRLARELKRTGEATITHDGVAAQLKIKPLVAAPGQLNGLQKRIKERIPKSTPAASIPLPKQGADEVRPAPVTSSISARDMIAIMADITGIEPEKFAFLNERTVKNRKIQFFFERKVERLGKHSTADIFAAMREAVNLAAGTELISIYVNPPSIVINHPTQLKDLHSDKSQLLKAAYAKHLKKEDKLEPTIKLGEDCNPLPARVSTARATPLAQEWAPTYNAGHDRHQLFSAIKNMSDNELLNFVYHLEQLARMGDLARAWPQEKEPLCYAYLLHAARLFIHLADALYKQNKAKNIYYTFRNFIRHGEHDVRKWDTYFNLIDPLVTVLKDITSKMRQDFIATLLTPAEQLAESKIFENLNAVLAPYETELRLPFFGRNDAQNTQLKQKYDLVLQRIRCSGLDAEIIKDAILMVFSLQGELSQSGVESHIHAQLGHAGIATPFLDLRNNLLATLRPCERITYLSGIPSEAHL